MGGGQKNYGSENDGGTNTVNDFFVATSSTDQLARENVYTVKLEHLKEVQQTEEYDPYHNREVKHPTTNFETLIHLLKVSLGTGIMAMPSAFTHSGWVLGIILTSLIGCLCTYCVNMLITCEYELCKRKKIPSLTYPAIAELALQEGPPLFQKIAPYSQHIINFFLMLYQIGICSVYTVFIGENVQLVLKDLWVDIDARWLMLIFLLPLIVINYVKSLKFLAPLSTIANFVTVISFGIIVYYIVKHGVTVEDRTAFGNYKEYPLFMGTVLFALESVGAMLPLENEMKTPKSFISPFGVLNSGMAIIVLLYILMGLFGFLAYGKDVEGSISYNIGTEIPAEICKLLLAFAVFITHALQMYVAIDITWNHYLLPKLEKNPYQNVYQYIVRTFLVVLCFALAVTIPYIDLFISLFGALALSSLALTFPAVIETATYWRKLKGIRGGLIILKNSLIAILGCFGLIVGTWTNMEKIIEKFTT